MPQTQSVLHILLRCCANVLSAAVALDAAGLLAALHRTAVALPGAVAPAWVGGRAGSASLRRLFRSDGFFSYADERQAQARLGKSEHEQ